MGRFRRFYHVWSYLLFVLYLFLSKYSETNSTHHELFFVQKTSHQFVCQISWFVIGQPSRQDLMLADNFPVISYCRGVTYDKAVSEAAEDHSLSLHLVCIVNMRHDCGNKARCPKRDLWTCSTMFVATRTGSLDQTMMFSKHSFSGSCV